MTPELFDLHAEIEQRHWWFLARRDILRALVERATLPGAAIVDVGCGTGANAAALADQRNAMGIDPSVEGIELASERFPSVRFLQGHAPEDLDAAARAADLFMLTDVIEHVPDDFHLVSSLVAVADPGTQFLITVPADPALWSVHDESFGHYRRYTPERLSMVWEGLPMRVRLLSHFNARLEPIVRAVRRYGSTRRKAAGKAGTDFSIPPKPANSLLRRIMAGERKSLLAAIDSSRMPYTTGVSLVALLEREAGAVRPRTRPDGTPPDLYDPSSGRRIGP